MWNCFCRFNDKLFGKWKFDFKLFVVNDWWCVFVKVYVIFYWYILWEGSFNLIWVRIWNCRVVLVD